MLYLLIWLPLVGPPTYFNSWLITLFIGSVCNWGLLGVVFSEIQGRQLPLEIQYWKCYQINSLIRCRLRTFPHLVKIFIASRDYEMISWNKLRNGPANMFLDLPGQWLRGAKLLVNLFFLYSVYMITTLVISLNFISADNLICQHYSNWSHPLFQISTFLHIFFQSQFFKIIRFIFILRVFIVF